MINNAVSHSTSITVDLFRRITELEIRHDGIVEKRVANMTDELRDILNLMGEKCEKYYV